MIAILYVFFFSTYGETDRWVKPTMRLIRTSQLITEDNGIDDVREARLVVCYCATRTDFLPSVSLS